VKICIHTHVTAELPPRPSIQFCSTHKSSQTHTHTHIHTYTHTHTHTYTHTHTHTYTRTLYIQKRGEDQRHVHEAGNFAFCGQGHDLYTPKP